MFAHLYFDDEKTHLMPGDVIKWSPDYDKLTFYRKEIRLLIGNTKDDAMIVYDTFRFISDIALITGLKPIQSNGYTEWTLVDE